MLPFTLVNYFDTVKSCNSKAIFESLQSPDTLFSWQCLRNCILNSILIRDIF